MTVPRLGATRWRNISIGVIFYRMKFDNGIEDKKKAIALIVGRSMALLDSGLMSNVILPLHFIVPTQ
eukprot:scaffold749_cov242-Chaetoceros_neogracile.AAC.7